MTPTPQRTSPRVFISYAHESHEHEEAVRELWLLLRRLGIDARVDRTAAEQRQDWPIWMMGEVGAADHVLVVASAAYCARAEGRADAADGRGVQFEARLIREEVYRGGEAALQKFVPVVLPGGSADDIPQFLFPATTTHYRLDTLSRAGVETLLRLLTKQPSEVEPVLGAIPELPARDHGGAEEIVAALPSLAHELLLDIECDEGEVHCRALLAGTLLSDRTSPLPAGIATVWDALKRPPAAADERLAAIGRRLLAALLDEVAVGHLLALLDRSPLGTVVDIVTLAEGPALGLPYELMRLADGRPLVTIPGAQMRRRVRGIDRPPPERLPGPLKILVAVGAPEETRTQNAPLDIEAEMQAILDAVGGAESAGRAQVRILEVGSPQQIEEALVADQYHVLHLSAHGSSAGVELEDEDGRPVPVSAAELVRRLRAARRPLPLVVLSSCGGAAHGAGGLATRLIEGGLDRVLAMQSSVSDAYATSLGRHFYDALAQAGSTSVSGALALARRDVEEERMSAARASARVAPPPEYGVGTLLMASEDPALVTESAERAPLQRPTQAPGGGAVRRLKVGELIGRRPQLRDALSALRGGDAADERWGALSGVVLTGVGGIGKTALAGRIEGRLAGEGWLTAVHEGSWDPPALINAVAGALASAPAQDSQAAAERAHLADPAVADTAKLDLVCRLLAARRMLLLFDDFERNLDAADGSFRDPGFAEVFERLCASTGNGRLLVTSRYPIPSVDPFLLRIAVPPLSPAELRRLLLRMPELRALGGDERQAVMRTIGGHPRLIEFVNALLRGGRGNLKSVTVKLRGLAKEHGIALAGPRPLEQTLSEAVLLGSRDILLAELLAFLDDEAREVALQAAVSTLPLTRRDLAVACFGPEVGQPQAARVAQASERLLDLTLLSPADDDEVVVHPWIANALSSHQGDGEAARHRRAVAMRLARFPDGRGAFGDLVEICRHHAATFEIDDLIDFALAAVEALRAQLGALSVSGFLGEVVPMVPAEAVRFLPLADRELTALVETGSIGAAIERATMMLRVAEKRCDLDPTNAMAQRDLSVSHEKLGNLALQAGDGTLAAEHYNAALTIAQRLADADATNATAQRDLSVSHERLGDLARQAGDGTLAAEHYNAALTIRQRLADADPTNATAQRDLSVSHNKHGDLALQAGDGTLAAEHYNAALTIRQRLADADPTNATAQRDLSISHNKLGDLALQAGDGTLAAEHYTAALTIAQRLADADPTNATAQRDLSVSHNNLGNLALQAGDGTLAAEHYNAALTIAQRLADADATNATAHRDLSYVQEKLSSLSDTSE
ncbi:MAG: CHAT domain-containing protein [Chloroflexi bacterium]|nr:CHAT domain-containing protein [Chloroflexota bacterium]